MKKRILLLVLSLILSFCPTLAKDKFEVINDTAGIYIFKINTKPLAFSKNTRGPMFVNYKKLYKIIKQSVF